MGLIEVNEFYQFMIANQISFPGAKFFADDEIRVIGNVDDHPLSIVGYDADGEILLSYEKGEKYFAIPLKELISQSQSVTLKN